jgi:hypothetical protein
MKARFQLWPFVSSSAFSAFCALVGFAVAACGVATTAAHPGGGGSAGSGGGGGAGSGGSAGSGGGGAGSGGGGGSAGSGGGEDGAVLSGDGGVMGASAGKRGVAYGFKSDADLAAFGKSVSWWYNWSSQPDAGVTSANVEFVPMVWGGTFDVDKLAASIPQGARYLLTFNEPNFGTQANLTPAQAAALWPKIEELATKRGLKIVSPALNYCGGNCNETDPFVWLDNFFAACAGCRVDYIAMHWYACTGSALSWYLGKYESKYTQPLWLTEFSCLDNVTISDTLESQYQQDALKILEGDARVFRYSWFTGRFTQKPVVNLLAAGSGQLTTLGQSYVDFPPGTM